MRKTRTNDCIAAIEGYCNSGSRQKGQLAAEGRPSLSGHDSSLGACSCRWSGRAGPPECVTLLTTGEADLLRRARQAREPGSGHLGYPEVGQRELELADFEHWGGGFLSARPAHGHGP